MIGTADLGCLFIVRARAVPIEAVRTRCQSTRGVGVTRWAPGATGMALPAGYWSARPVPGTGAGPEMSSDACVLLLMASGVVVAGACGGPCALECCRKCIVRRVGASYKASGPDASGAYDASYSVVQGVGARRVGDVRRVVQCRTRCRTAPTPYDTVRHSTTALPL